MIEKIRAAICRIDIIQDGQSVARGSGTLIANGTVLTAFHVVGNRKAVPPAVYPGEIRVTFPCGATVGQLFDPYFDAHEDWALVKLAEPPAIRPVPLAPRCDNGVPWETYGFPDANPRDGMVQTGNIENDRGELEGCQVLQLFSKQAAAGTGAPVKGLSGGPVLIQDALVGVMRFALMKEGMTVAGTLYACPVDTVLQKAGVLLPVPDPCYGLPGIPRKDPLPADPFRYLSRFTEDEAEIFFGRKREIRQLYDMVTQDDAPSVILLYGQSGVGKSSFLDAGLVPRLQWDYATLYQRRTPERSLTETLIATLTPTQTARTLLEAWKAAETAAGRPVLAIFDQIEEVYTQPNPMNRGELEAFVQELKAVFGDPASRPRGKLILSFRKEWFPEVQKQIELQQIPYLKMFLEVMDRDAIGDSIAGLTTTQRLIKNYGLKVEPGLAGSIAEDLLADDDSPIATALQILLTKMWTEAIARDRHAPAFTLELYRRLKQKGLLLADFLNQQLLALRQTDPALVDSGLALDLLTYHTTNSMTAEQRTRAQVLKAYENRADVIPALLNRCREVALLVDAGGDNTADSAVTRLTHDTLAPVVVRKFAQSALPGQRARRLLESRAADWDERQSAPLAPWEMNLIEAGLPGMRQINDKQKRLVDRARAQHEATRRKNRKIRAALYALLVAILALSIWAQYSRKKAVDERDIANLHHQFEVVIDELSVDPYLGLLYAVSAVHSSLEHPAVKRVMSELQYALSQAILEGRELNSVNRSVPVTALDVGAQVVVAGRIDGKLQLHSLDGNQTRAEFDAHKGPVTDVAVSPDGTWFASAGQDGVVKLWHRDGGPDHDLLTLPPQNVDGKLKKRFATSMAATADGAAVVSGWNDGVLRILPVYGTGAPVEVRFPDAGGETHEITAVASKRSRDHGLLVFVGFSHGEVALYSLTDRKLVYPPWKAHPDRVISVDLNVEQGYAASNESATEIHMVSASRKGVVKLWNGGNSLLNEPMQFHNPVNSVRFNSFGNQLVFATEDGQVSVSDLEGRPYFPPFQGFTAAARVAIFDSESLHILAASHDGSVRVLDLSGQAIRFPALTDHHRVTALAFHPNGRLLAGVTARHAYFWGVDTKSPTQPLSLSKILDLDGAHALAIDPAGKTLAIGGAGWIRFWDFATQALSEGFPVHCSIVNALAFNPGGDLLAIAGEHNGAADPGYDEAIDLWNMKERRVVGSFPSQHHTVRTMTFSGDGRYLFTGGDDLRARRWDLRLPQFWTKPHLLVDQAGHNVFFGGVYAMAFTPAHDTLAIGDATGTVTRWQNGVTYRDSFKAHNGPVQGIQVHPLGEAMYSVSDSGHLREDSLRTTETLAVPMQRLGSGMFALALSPDGTALASGAEDGAVELWRSHWDTNVELACTRLLRHPRFQTPPEALKPIFDEVNRACSTRFWTTPEAQARFVFDYSKK